MLHSYPYCVFQVAEEWSITAVHQYSNSLGIKWLLHFGLDIQIHTGWTWKLHIFLDFELGLIEEKK